MHAESLETFGKLEWHISIGSDRARLQIYFDWGGANYMGSSEKWHGQYPRKHAHEAYWA